MKRVLMSAALVAAIAFTSCKTEKKEEKQAVAEQSATTGTKEIALADVSFGVRGNCSMCKKTIETAVLGVEGVSTANWNVNKKKIDVSFDEAKTNLDAIHTAIAGAGYDTEKMKGDETAYSGLPGCCQYDHTMAMNQMGEGDETKKGHGNH